MSEATLVVDALRRVRRVSGVSLAFAGMVSAGATKGRQAVRLEHFVGNTVGALSGVSVDIGHGLGGKVISVNRPVVVDDYLRTPNITHRYNAIIAAEGLRAMAAAPVIVDRRPVAVLYGALHTDDPIGSRTFDVLAAEARALEQQIVTARVTAAAGSSSEMNELRDRLTQAYSRLRLLERTVDDQTLASELERITETLLDDVGATVPAVSLTGREQDVLALAALGHGNARIAEELGIGVQTAKGYVKDAMNKLGASTRLEAVVSARRQGLLP
ncbi:LuxR C-terminal-related transcriptional regulator [Gordonia rhizosphera]|uniref:Putative LuxR family transcriptional regulator n=1 Tax=Gordonia rhizosphera NBRC 16068 TaxID=1108045 RepID=K6W3W7_9ACTN|nr:LuxR C-terminal-related transcriptional regulator [Gordonia rhizosphera]GAB93830.1 putative LuxR family transcriptional regulator [Gordonia rhizosphera NBRC 16068]